MDYLYFDRNTLPEILHIFGICLRFTDLSELPNIFIVKSIFRFMHDFAAECKFNIDLSIQVIRFCFHYIDNPDVQSMCADTFYVVSNTLKVQMSTEVFQQLLTHIYTVLDRISSVSIIENLVTGLFNITKNYESSEDIFNTRSQCFQLVQMRLQKYLESPLEFREDKLNLFVVIKILTSSFVSVDASRETGANQKLISRVSSPQALS